MPSHTIRARPPRPSPGHPDREPEIDRSPEAIGRHLEDAAHYPGGHADGVARPRSEADVARLLRVATHVLPIGAQSSVTGGATPAGGLVLSTERLTTVQEAGRDRIRVAAGISIDALQELLASTGRWYAPFPTFTGASIGGIVATNAAGAATFKYGTTRAWVEGLTVVLACGCVLDVSRGEVSAAGPDGIGLDCAHGRRVVTPGSYTMPSVPKCSAGYFASPDMDVIDLFIGAEGTLGIVLDATLRVLPKRPATAFAMVPVPSETIGMSLVGDLRAAAARTWATRDPNGIDIAAIEQVDRRCLQLLSEDGVDRRLGISVPPATALLLFIQLELPPRLAPADAFDQIATSTAADAPDTALVRFCRRLAADDVFEDSELALPSDTKRIQQMLAFREGAPTSLNRRVGEAKRLIDDRIEKTAADMIVPFDRFDEMMARYRDGYTRRGLDYAIWGHVSDGNVHPNVIPRSYDDIVAGREAILEFGRDATHLGGSPLAEHGVGRSRLKQRLLEQLYGARGIAEMRAVKQVLDPEGRLAPGVLFGSNS